MTAKATPSKSGGNYRSAKSGQYVTPAYGKSHKSTTVKESAPKKSK